MNSKIPRSPLAPENFPDMPPIAGVRMVCMPVGFRYKERNDFWLAVMETGTRAAGVFTRSATAAASVHWCRKALANGGDQARAVMVTAGNANAFTGTAGDQSVADATRHAAQIIGCSSHQVMIAQTGVIGEPFPTGKLTRILPTAVQQLSRPDWSKAAETIATTDTFAKGATRATKINGQTVVINGIAKGSGMIAPNMATMLGFIFTDAALPAPVLDQLLREAVDRSFNAITVDSDTSTSDAVMMFATGKVAPDKPVSTVGDPALSDFRAALIELCQDLACQIVRDGEGASKFITIRIEGTTNDADAKRVALAIANSPLVKTAIAGQDANWGRVVMAIGNSGVAIDQGSLSIAFGPHPVARDGARASGYDESVLSAYMKSSEIEITATIGSGPGQATVWTCDLTHGYIDINADYRS